MYLTTFFFTKLKFLASLVFLGVFIDFYLAHRIQQPKVSRIFWSYILQVFFANCYCLFFCQNIRFDRNIQEKSGIRQIYFSVKCAHIFSKKQIHKVCTILKFLNPVQFHRKWEIQAVTHYWKMLTHTHVNIFRPRSPDKKIREINAVHTYFFLSLPLLITYVLT